MPKVRQLGFAGGHYIDVVGVVFPRKCYSKDHPVNFGEGVEYGNKLMNFAKGLFGTISSEGAYDHVVPSVDYGLYISFDAPQYNQLMDEEIPFWQLVYHGVVLSNPRTYTVNASVTGLELTLVSNDNFACNCSKFLENTSVFSAKFTLFQAKLSM